MLTNVSTLFAGFRGITTPDTFATTLASLSPSAPLPAGPVKDFDPVPLWYVRHDTAVDHAISDLLLTQEDIREFSRTRHAPARCRSLRTRARLREALTAAAGGAIAPLDWTFARDGNGKPYLPTVPTLHFSCSHSPLLSIIAVTKAGPIGVDIATLPHGGDSSLIDGFLSRAEQDALSELPAAARPAAIARLWAMKEATLKMLGIGLSCDMSRLDFALDRNALRSVPDGLPELTRFNVSTYSISERSHTYCAAIAWRG